MFDIGFSELLLIGFVALIVLGPERLPKAARFAGLWVRKARAQWYAVRAELESELAAEELRNEIRGPLDTTREIEALVRDVAASPEKAPQPTDDKPEDTGRPSP